ncbi:DUF4178 domain-containing protein [Cellulosimicrobium marinum]|uniref:DUF4178 domain-containing protein n=1 Tax=Cellulosimicrobium marinum TaxID=1638992 RepID=UPI001E4C8B60|nr:DUF4178 domain-containing protein [Cellulosimicrobium marinum]MCB7135585.1 DUF4178 domain-containing protein [Cellulosimicrobium marinum]
MSASGPGGSGPGTSGTTAAGARLSMRVGEELVGEGPEAPRTRVRAAAVLETTQAGSTSTWEEWQLVGADGSDLWVEHDHDSGDVTLYRPTETDPPVVDLSDLHRGRALDLRLDGRPHRLHVRERGTGTVRAVAGTFAEPFVPGQRVEYADLAGHGVVVSVERTTAGPLGPVTSVYAGRRLDVAEQKRLFGRRLAPRGRGRSTFGFLAVAVVSVFAFAACQASASDDDGSCTPRTVVTAPASGEPTSTSTESSSCVRRPVYGGGGGGLGK